MQEELSFYKRHYDVLEEPRGEVYRGLLRYLSQLCSLFVLLTNPTDTLGERGRLALKALSPDLVEHRITLYWPGVSPPSDGELERCSPQHAPTVYLFRLTEHSLSILLTISDGLWDWEEPDLPENLCLLRASREPCLVSSVLDRFTYLYLTPHEMERLLGEIPQLRVELVPEDEEWDEPIYGEH